ARSPTNPASRVSGAILLFKESEREMSSSTWSQSLRRTRLTHRRRLLEFLLPIHSFLLRKLRGRISGLSRELSWRMSLNQSLNPTSHCSSISLKVLARHQLLSSVSRKPLVFEHARLLGPRHLKQHQSPRLRIPKPRPLSLRRRPRL